MEIAYNNSRCHSIPWEINEMGDNSEYSLMLPQELELFVEEKAQMIYLSKRSFVLVKEKFEPRIKIFGELEHHLVALFPASLHANLIRSNPISWPFQKSFWLIN